MCRERNTKRHASSGRETQKDTHLQGEKHKKTRDTQKDTHLLPNLKHYFFTYFQSICPLIVIFCKLEAVFSCFLAIFSCQFFINSQILSQFWSPVFHFHPNFFELFELVHYFLHFFYGPPFFHPFNFFAHFFKTVIQFLIGFGSFFWIFGQIFSFHAPLMRFVNTVAEFGRSPGGALTA